MTWVYFEDRDRQMAAPAFSLERAGGGHVALQDFYEQSMLVLLFPSPNWGLQDGLEPFEARLDEIERQGAQVAALLPVTEHEGILHPPLGDFTYALIIDRGERVRKKYAGLVVADLVPEGSALLYVLDVYGAPWAAYIGETLDEDGLVDEVLSWLVFIGVQCPE